MVEISNTTKYLFYKYNDMEVIFMNKREKKVFYETKIRNMERYLAKIIEIPALAEDAICVKADIDNLKRELEYM